MSHGSRRASVEDTASLGGHMARSAMCSTRAILLRPLDTVPSLDGSSPVSGWKQKGYLWRHNEYALMHTQQQLKERFP